MAGQGGEGGRGGMTVIHIPKTPQYVNSKNRPVQLKNITTSNYCQF